MCRGEHADRRMAENGSSAVDESTPGLLREEEPSYSPSWVSFPRLQLLQMCLISLPMWQWMVKGMLLLLLCCGCSPGPFLLLRDMILTRLNAFFFGFSDDTGVFSRHPAVNQAPLMKMGAGSTAG